MNPDSNDSIFVYESATQYTAALTLRSGQRLIGQDATTSLQTIAAISSIPSYSASLPAMNSGNAIVTNIGSTDSTANVNATVQNCRFQCSRATTVSYALNENSSGDISITGK